MAICISDLKKILLKAPSFFTTWSTILWLISIYFKYTLNINVPNFMMVTAQNLIITCCIVGYYIIYEYGHKLLDKYKSLNLYHIHIMNNISHILPFIIILYFYNFEFIKTYDELMQSGILFILLIKLYLSIYDPTKVYWFTGWKLNKMLIIGSIIYIFLYFIK